MNKRSIVAAEPSNLSEAVIEAVAEAEEVDPVELTPPLFEVIDPDALDQVFGPTPTDGRRIGQVSFSYNGYAVSIRSDGYVSVDSREE